MKVLLLIVAQILGESPMEYVKHKEVEFKNLPIVCKSEYDQDLLEFRKATSTEVAYCDLDGDGKNEILSFEGNAGSGGYTWNIISKNKKVDEVFGSLYIIRKDKTNGILVSHSLGWEEVNWRYYELKNGKLEQLYELEAHYLSAKNNILHEKVKSLKIILNTQN